MNGSVNPNSLIESATKASASFSTQLLATKFFVPVAPGHVITRSRLNAFLDKSLTYPLTLVSAPAGFGKTTLLSTWAQSLQVPNLRLCWVSLDEEDNDPRLFWSYLLTALDRQQPECFQPLLIHLQSQPPPLLKSLLTTLINLLAESTDHFILVLDDYQVITEEQVHTTLSYLVQHLPSQLRIIIATRADPPLPLPMQRARHHMLEVRTDQLRCTAEETRAFLHEVMGIQLPEQTIQEVTTRTEGWLVGLHLLGLSLPQQQADPLTLLQQVSGEQCYIVDYLTEVVLRQQPQEVQTFLLCTSILERLTAPLCDAVMEQTGSQQMLHHLEQANLFLVALDNKRQWYRYHALFAEALRHQLEQRQGDLVPIFHHRASIWYAEHNQMAEAILHAISSQQWQWAMDLIEGLPLMTLNCFPSKYEQEQVRDWLVQIPLDMVGSRPHLCITCSLILWAYTPHFRLFDWLAAAEAKLVASLARQPPASSLDSPLTPQARQEQENLLGEVVGMYALLKSYEHDAGSATLILGQRALCLLSTENYLARALVALSHVYVYYCSSVNDAEIALEKGHQVGPLACAGRNISFGIAGNGLTSLLMIGTGRLREVHRLSQQGIKMGSEKGKAVLPEVSLPLLAQVEILREWNQLDTALALALQAYQMCKQVKLMQPTHFSFANAILLRVYLSRGELEAAHSALQQFEAIVQPMNPACRAHNPSCFTTVDQVRLWLMSGEQDRAMDWAKSREMGWLHGSPLAHEREDVALARILLAAGQPTLALKQLEPVLQRATAGQRWGHVIEIRLLQALAHQMLDEEPQALAALAEAVRLGEPEGYLRSFVEEGEAMAVLLSKLREEQRKAGLTPYLDHVLAAFPKPSQMSPSPSKRRAQLTQAQPLLEPVSERELQVLQLMAKGASNQEIAQELVIVVDTVKRHVSRIFAKLRVHNRVQAVKQAYELGLLDKQF